MSKRPDAPQPKRAAGQLKNTMSQTPVKLVQFTDARQAAWRSAAGWSAVMAAGVCLFVIAMLTLAIRDDRRLAPLNAPQITQLKTELLDRPNDQALKQVLRQRDQELRRGFFDRLALMRHGGWLMVGAGAALVLALKSYGKFADRPAEIPPERADIVAENRAARWGVCASGAIVIGVMGSWAFLQRPTLPSAAVAVAEPMFPIATAQELGKNWISFRGNNGDGVVRDGTVPESWDGPAGKGILWKSPVPLAGHSSPVIFQDRIFLTGGDASTQDVLCFAAGDGKLLWRSSVPHTGGKVEVFQDTGHAANTCVTDGVRVYAIFAGGDLAAFDFAGKRVWAKSLGVPESQYSYASSLAIYQGRVIVQFDEGQTEENSKSALYCFDGATGKQAWKTPRPVQNAWTSPIVVDGRIYTAGNPLVMAYNAADGKEIWRAKVLEGDVACSPVFADGVVYVANDRAVAAAIRADGSGDVTASHVKWSNAEIALPDMVSPLTDGKSVLLVSGGGEVNSLDARTGKKRWSHDIKGGFRSSPILAGNLVYLVSETGVTHVFALGDSYKEVRTCPLGEPVSASPAVAGGRLYFRGKENLWCIGS